MPIRRWLAALLVSCVLVPTLAAARPACCVKVQAPKRPACCATMAASAPKSCCKAPATLRPESRAKDGLTGLPLLVVLHTSAARAVTVMRSPATSLREARLDHRALSPDDSPPDLLALRPALLI